MTFFYFSLEVWVRVSEFHFIILQLLSMELEEKRGAKKPARYRTDSWVTEFPSDPVPDSGRSSILQIVEDKRKRNTKKQEKKKPEKENQGKTKQKEKTQEQKKEKEQKQIKKKKYVKIKIN